MFNNGTLFSIHDIFMHNLLVQQARYYFLTDFFVGAKKVNGTWQWEDGTPFNYTRWAQNEPSKSGDCISVVVSWSQWYAVDCKSKSEGDCQSRAIWDPDLKTCLVPIQGTKNYTLAEGECESYRGMLISVHNAFENGVVQQEANMFFIYYYYLGAQRRGNTWTWIDGTPFTYQNWAQNEPAATGLGTNLITGQGLTPYYGVNLVPFGPDAGDMRVNDEMLTGGQTIDLHLFFPFYGGLYNYTSISGNGYISFATVLDQGPVINVGPLDTNWPTHQDPAMIAPYLCKQQIPRDHGPGLKTGVFYRLLLRQSLFGRQSDSNMNMGGSMPSSFFTQNMRQACPNTPNNYARCNQESDYQLNEWMNWLQEGIAGAQMFRADAALVVTWFNTASAISGRSDVDAGQLATYQLIWLTDSNARLSYVIFNYDRLGFDAADFRGNSRSGRCQALFNGGNHTGMVPVDPTQMYKNSPKVLASQSGVPHMVRGRYMFRVDDVVRPGGCSNKTGGTFPMMIYPNIVNMLGETTVDVNAMYPRNFTNPDLNNRMDTGGARISDDSMYSVQLGLYVIGYKEFKDDNIKKFRPEHRIIARLGSYANKNQYEYRWRPQEERINLNQVEQWYMTDWERMNELYTYRFGYLKLAPIINLDQQRPTQLPAGLVSHPISLHWMWTTNNPEYQTTTYSQQEEQSRVDFVKKKAMQMCHDWYNEDGAQSNFIRDTETNASCPCVERQAMADLGRFMPHPRCSQTFRDITCTQSIGARNCYMSAQNVYGSYAGSGRTDTSHTTSRVPTHYGQVCCYDKEGFLMQTSYQPVIKVTPEVPYNPGFPLRAYEFGTSPYMGQWEVPGLSAFHNDYMPYFLCCKYSDFRCQMFYWRRPSSGCQEYQPPAYGEAMGAGIFNTIDNDKFIFNEPGVYTLLYIPKTLTTPEVRIQVRLERYPNRKVDFSYLGRWMPQKDLVQPSNATVITGIAIEATGTDRVHVLARKDTRRFRYRTSVIVGNILRYFDTMHIQRFTGVLVYVNSVERGQAEIYVVLKRHKLEESFNRDIDRLMNYQESFGMLNVALSVPPQYGVRPDGDKARENEIRQRYNLPKVSGLMRPFPEQTMSSQWQRDLQMQDVNSESYRQQIVQNYKIHGTGESGSDQNLNTQYNSDIPTDNMFTASKQEDSKFDECGDNWACLYNYALLNSKVIGEESYKSWNSHINLRNDAVRQYNSCGPINIEYPEYLMKVGSMDSAYLDGDVAQFECFQSHWTKGTHEYKCGMVANRERIVTAEYENKNHSIINLDIIDLNGIRVINHGVDLEKEENFFIWLAAILGTVAIIIVLILIYLCCWTPSLKKHPYSMEAEPLHPKIRPIDISDELRAPLTPHGGTPTKVPPRFDSYQSPPNASTPESLRNGNSKGAVHGFNTSV
ncbi:unnamed protein product, partial [Mesorhabditis belari]|uniref:Uncharacterized protein n=1 Tax=Mesorhabditis belari TaxID=2138241 RepID=A0AAF3FS74_9BILA